MKPARAGVALGSNLGNRLENLQKARDQIFGITGVHPPILQSAIYETAPVNCEPAARNFYNAVVEIGFEGSAESLLQALRQVEAVLGRARESRTDLSGRRSLSRTIDLDLLYVGEKEIDQPELQLPHPRMTARRFVLQPLADIHRHLQLPGQTATIDQLLVRLPPDKAMKRVAEKW